MGKAKAKENERQRFSVMARFFIELGIIFGITIVACLLWKFGVIPVWAMLLMAFGGLFVVEGINLVLNRGEEDMGGISM